jgi:hypothetical protein
LDGISDDMAQRVVAFYSEPNFMGDLGYEVV